MQKIGEAMQKQAQASGAPSGAEGGQQSSGSSKENIEEAEVEILDKEEGK